ncbi:MAG TPA: histidine kinase [Oceanospirillales bacterium]|uniref:TorF family putative porin n=1 Tax=Thalassolituus sp. UBA2590 TaxID=1947663 RepID=UPI000ED25494|nr:TorF family putative porin [Thalassolituus sp. UBA2590]HCG80509.1 histidine kinase [Oceanospirillales bacterium]
MKKLTKAIALAGVMTTGLTGAQLAQAEVDVSASAAVASMYLWRGLDLGNGSPAVSGDITLSTGGAYAGMWTSSGDSAAGNEYDLYVGYGGEMEGFSYDVSVLTYVYPSANNFTYVDPSDEDENGVADVLESDQDTSGNTFDLSELIVSLGYEGASFSYYYPVSSNPDDYSYLTLGYGMDAYSATVGVSNSDADSDKYVHLDLSYAYTDNLSFTASKVVDAELDETEDDLKFVVSYSLPIDL